MRAQITGWSHLPFGKRDEPDVESLMRAVTSDALRHAGVEARDLDGIFVGVMNNGFSRQGFEASLVGVGVPELSHIPATRLENACATGSAALYAALDFIEAGRGRIALVVGAEKMTALPTGDVGDVLLCASYHREESQYAGFAGIFGEIARRYFARYGDKSWEMAMIAAKNHRNGVGNPYAHIRKDLGFDFCNTVSEKNPYVAEPLPRRIGFRARAQANDILPISRRDPLEFAGARRAWAQALGAAGLSLEDLDLIELHDCFTIAELIAYEAMGWVPRGEGARVVREGWAEKSGRLPVNPSGGLKAKGHPIGATGVSMHIVAAMQLLGEAGELQIPDARLAGVFNMGGVSVANYVSILERVE